MRLGAALRICVCAALAFSLAACGGSGVETASKPAARVGVQFVPDQTGLAVAGTGQRIDFGRSPRGVIPVMDRETGAHTPLALGGCPSGVTQQLLWDDLTLTFTRERFVGWKTSAARAGQTCD